MITPDEQGCRQCRQHLHSFAGCAGLHFRLILRDVTTLKVEPAGMKVKVGPFEATHFAPTKCRGSSCGNPLTPFRKEQRWVVILGPASFDVFSEGLQGCGADQELASLPTLADHLAAAKVLDTTIRRLVSACSYAVDVELA
jgi:hypothetical protein